MQYMKRCRDAHLPRHLAAALEVDEGAEAALQRPWIVPVEVVETLGDAAEGIRQERLWTYAHSAWWQQGPRTGGFARDARRTRDLSKYDDKNSNSTMG